MTLILISRVNYEFGRALLYPETLIITDFFIKIKLVQSHHPPMQLSCLVDMPTKL